VAGGNVFTSWPALMTAVGAVQGVRVVLIDTTFAAATVPAGTWNLDNVQIVGGPTGFALTFASGAHITGRNFYFTNLTITIDGPGTVFTAVDFAELQFYFCTIQSTAAGLMSDAPIGTGMLILLSDNTIAGVGGTTVFSFESTGSPPPSAITLVAGSSLAANATTGAGDLAVSQGVECAIVSPQLAGMARTLLFLNASSGDNAAIVPVNTTATILCNVTVSLQPFQSVDIFAEACFEPLAGTANTVTLQVFDNITGLDVAVQDHTTTTGSSQVSITKINRSFSTGSHTFTLQATASGGTTGCQIGAHLARIAVRVYG